MPGMAAQGAVPLDDGLGLGLGGHNGLEPGGGSPFDGAVGVGGHGHGGGGAGRPNQKQRFVWTAELHHRFEAAVNTLGIDHAKPQAIRRLMGCDGEENAPTRQNIKSHLQKYRLFFSKRLGRRGAKGGGGGDDDGELTGHEVSEERLQQTRTQKKLHEWRSADAFHDIRFRARVGERDIFQASGEKGWGAAGPTAAEQWFSDAPSSWGSRRRARCPRSSRSRGASRRRRRSPGARARGRRRSRRRASPTPTTRGRCRSR